MWQMKSKKENPLSLINRTFHTEALSAEAHQALSRHISAAGHRLGGAD